MNAIDERISRFVATREPAHLARLQFGYMDGYPSDFPARTADRCQVLVAAFGTSRSQTLRSARDTTRLLNDRLLIPWKESDDAYKAAFAESIRTGAVVEPLKVFILVYQPRHLFTIERALWVKHFDVGNEPQYSERYTDQAGREMLRFTKVFDDGTPPKPICMGRDKFTVLLLWAEFLIKVFEHVEASVLNLGDPFDGLVMFSDLLSGDSEMNGDRGARVLRSLINDAYRDRVTFKNYDETAQDTHVGELLVDNLAGCVGRKLRETGKPFLGEPPEKIVAHYHFLDPWADVVEWPLYRRITCP